MIMEQTSVKLDMASQADAELFEASQQPPLHMSDISATAQASQQPPLHMSDIPATAPVVAVTTPPSVSTIMALSAPRHQQQHHKSHNSSNKHFRRSIDLQVPVAQTGAASQEFGSKKSICPTHVQQRNNPASCSSPAAENLPLSEATGSNARVSSDKVHHCLVSAAKTTSCSTGKKCQRSDEHVEVVAARNVYSQQKPAGSAARCRSSSVPPELHSRIAAVAGGAKAATRCDTVWSPEAAYGRCRHQSLDLVPGSQVYQAPSHRTAAVPSQNASPGPMTTEGRSGHGFAKSAAAQRPSLQLQNTATRTSRVSLNHAKDCGPRHEHGELKPSHELWKWKDAAAAIEQGYRDLRSNFSIRLDKIRSLGSLGMHAHKSSAACPWAAALGSSSSTMTQSSEAKKLPREQAHSAEAPAAAGTRARQGESGHSSQQLRQLSRSKLGAAAVCAGAAKPEPDSKQSRTLRHSMSALPPQVKPHTRFSADAGPGAASPLLARSHRPRRSSVHWPIDSTQLTRVQSKPRCGSMIALLPETSSAGHLRAGAEGIDPSPKPAAPSRSRRGSWSAAPGQIIPKVQPRAGTAANSGSLGTEPSKGSGMTASQELLSWKDAAAEAQMRRHPDHHSGLSPDKRSNSVETIMLLQAAMQSTTRLAPKSLNRSISDVLWQSGSRQSPSQHMTSKQQAPSAAALAAVGQHRSSITISVGPHAAYEGDMTELPSPVPDNHTSGIPLRKVLSAPLPAIIEQVNTQHDSNQVTSKMPTYYESGSSGAGHSGSGTAGDSGSGSSGLGYNPYIPQIGKIDERAMQKSGESDCAAYILNIGHGRF